VFHLLRVEKISVEDIREGHLERTVICCSLIWNWLAGCRRWDSGFGRARFLVTPTFSRLRQRFQEAWDQSLMDEHSDGQNGRGRTKQIDVLN
jgi:hypothetical protein